MDADGLLEHFRFVHQSMRDHAWVHGAGASKASWTPLAGELHLRATAAVTNLNS
ncbi:hypothetical protein [Nannocystis pusilla]|uniref:Uncharacterized protein n=1 Tax=Nannocystis pusilla TaxID=889268 RepID=A0ABS7TIT8_9BACT|nr:hypothetical protein [Nannocystis pusilla]MBZ5708143.1 hypothetical protein [Nannocystis pusilla]